MFEGYKQRAETGKDIVLTTYIKPVREIFFHLPFLIFFVLILNLKTRRECPWFFSCRVLALHLFRRSFVPFIYFLTRIFEFEEAYNIVRHEENMKIRS